MKRIYVPGNKVSFNTDKLNEGFCFIWSLFVLAGISMALLGGIAYEKNQLRLLDKKRERLYSALENEKQGLEKIMAGQDYEAD